MRERAQSHIDSIGASALFCEAADALAAKDAELAAREVIIETYEAQLTVHQRRAEQAEARVVELLATLRSLQEIPAPEFWAVYDTLRDIQTKAQHVSLFVDKIANLIPDPKAEP